MASLGGQGRRVISIIAAIRAGMQTRSGPPGPGMKKPAQGAGVDGWWRGEDLNLRSRSTTDLQSVPFGHSGTPPNRGR